MYRNVDKRNMKKIVAALISLLVVFALAGCGNKDKEAAKDKSDNKSGGGIFRRVSVGGRLLARKILESFCSPPT